MGGQGGTIVGLMAINEGGADLKGCEHPKKWLIRMYGIFYLKGLNHKNDRFIICIVKYSKCDAGR